MENLTPSKTPLDAPMSALAVESITVDFSGFKAVENLNFTLNQGELRFLIGPNGAGKTTLLDSICGRIKPSAGKVRFKDGTELSRLQEHQIVQKGIARKFQTPAVFGSLTVWDNLALSLRGPRSLFSSLRAKVTGEQKSEIEKWLHIIGLNEQSQTIAGSLSHGQKQWLEIGMVSGAKARCAFAARRAGSRHDRSRNRRTRQIARHARTASIYFGC